MEIITPKVKHGVVHRYPYTARFKYNGWPSICKDDKGNLYAVASTMRISHVCPFGKNGMWISKDNGETWSPTIIINDSNFDDRDTGIVYLGNGKMAVTWFTEVSEDNWLHMQKYDWIGPEDKAVLMGQSVMTSILSDEERENAAHSFVMLSDDYGMTWGNPIKVPVSAPHGCNVCKDGTLIYMGKYVDPDPDNGPDGSFAPIRVYSSFDGGKTWEFTATVPLGEGLPHNQFMFEPHIAELPSGRLIGAIRVHCRPENPSNTVYVTFSDDKGKTWTVPKLIDETVDGLPPHILVHSSGAVIISYGCREEGRRAEKAVVSYDEGATWTENYILDTNIIRQFDMGYPATVELDDGSLMTIYYQAHPDDSYTSILYTKWNLRGK